MVRPPPHLNRKFDKLQNIGTFLYPKIKASEICGNRSSSREICDTRLNFKGTLKWVLEIIEKWTRSFWKALIKENSMRAKWKKFNCWPPIPLDISAFGALIVHIFYSILTAPLQWCYIKKNFKQLLLVNQKAQRH